MHHLAGLAVDHGLVGQLDAPFLHRLAEEIGHAHFLARLGAGNIGFQFSIHLALGERDNGTAENFIGTRQLIGHQLVGGGGDAMQVAIARLIGIGADGRFDLLAPTGHLRFAHCRQQHTELVALHPGGATMRVMGGDNGEQFIHHRLGDSHGITGHDHREIVDRHDHQRAGLGFLAGFGVKPRNRVDKRLRIAARPEGVGRGRRVCLTKHKSLLCHQNRALARGTGPISGCKYYNPIARSR